MKLKKIAKVESGQDFAIHGGYFFDFVAHGICLGEVSVYELKDVLSANGEELEPLCRFIVGGTDKIIPHANTVFFGNEYYEEGDEFPLLYANVYNTYAKAENRREGILLVYRVLRDGKSFSADLVQTISIGFVEDRDLWKSCEGNGDVRPYGNFIADLEKNVLYAYVMRDKPYKTRYFVFDLPKLSDGEYNPEYGVKNKILTADEIKDTFDVDYHRTIQGAAVKDGVIYSLEGGSKRPGQTHCGAIRIILPEEKRLSLYQCLWDLGVNEEPEGIDFYQGNCYYVAGHGDTYLVEFD